jgi:hypothetical protein
MTLSQFIENHRDEIDDRIRLSIDDPHFNPNNIDREEWVLNDSYLFTWASVEVTDWEETQ